MKRNLVIKTIEKEPVLWNKIKIAIMNLCNLNDDLKYNLFWGYEEECKLIEMNIKKVSRDAIKYYIAYKELPHPKYILNKNKVFHNGHLIHRSYENVFHCL